jgi:hypothetical protein
MIVLYYKDDSFIILLQYYALQSSYLTNFNTNRGELLFNCCQQFALITS